ncbi:MAG: ThuA domain-containing protein [Bacteroidota bacterium]
MRYLFLVLFPCALTAQVTCGGGTSFQVLHFTKTSGFDHNTRSQSNTMFTEIGTTEGFSVVNTQDQTAFDNLTTLLAYEVIIFSNTSGNIPFTATQKMNLESYVAAGGGVLGIHAATDMYRDASYPFFTQLIGGSRRNSPAHTSANTNADMDLIGNHPTTANLPDPWNKTEEYYYWPDTGLVASIVEVLRVRDTGNNSWNDPRPISWHQNFPSGARSFYTALGHARGNYTDPDNDFRQHLRDALCWCVEAESTTLPVTLQNSWLTTAGYLHRIHWTIAPGSDEPGRVELHGGYEQAEAKLLQSSGEVLPTGFLEHLPDDSTRPFYYRLRFLDVAGLPSWSPWLTARPTGTPGARPQVQYGDREAVLFLPAGGPSTVLIFDASGRRVSALPVTEGRNVLPQLKPGVYFLRFPFQQQTLRYVVR